MSIEQTAQQLELAAQIRHTHRPLTFTHAGKTWTYHRPGDPMPCAGDKKVEVVLNSDKSPSFTKRGDVWIWGDCGNDSIIGWRYADEKTTDNETIPDFSDNEILQLRQLLNVFSPFLQNPLNKMGKP